MHRGGNDELSLAGHGVLRFAQLHIVLPDEGPELRESRKDVIDKFLRWFEVGVQEDDVRRYPG